MLKCGDIHEPPDSLLRGPGRVFSGLVSSSSCYEEFTDPCTHIPSNKLWSWVTSIRAIDYLQALLSGPATCWAWSLLNSLRLQSPYTRPLLHLLIGTGHREGQLGGDKRDPGGTKGNPRAWTPCSPFIHQAPGIKRCSYICSYTGSGLVQMDKD